MNHDEFNQAMRKLTSVYGEKAYPELRQAEIWRISNDLSYPTFKKVVIDLICEHMRGAPNIPVIAGKIREHRQRSAYYTQGELSVKAEQSEPCLSCNNTGAVLVGEMGYVPLAYQCHCRFGLAFLPGLPRLANGAPYDSPEDWT